MLDCKTAGDAASHAGVGTSGVYALFQGLEISQEQCALIEMGLLGRLVCFELETWNRRVLENESLGRRDAGIVREFLGG